jgi:glucose-6-phosphate dehydrogenase assembly protein OpcA
VAERRVTDATRSPDPIAALRTRADDYAPGDTDLAWTRITPWRTLIAGAFDAYRCPVTSTVLTADAHDPAAVLLGGWLTDRLGVTPTWDEAAGLTGARFTLTDGAAIALVADPGGSVVLRRSGLPDRTLPLTRRSLGDELAEELRRLDPDQSYAAALAAATGRPGLAHRPPHRVHVWQEPSAPPQQSTRSG